MPDNTVLVVDDTPANLRLVRAILEPLGWRVREAESGPDALQAVATDPPDLVLLDLNMPGMNGHEVCRRLREDPATRSLPIVMMTAAGHQERVNALDAGADDFVVHPLNREELAARVRSLLRIKEYHDTIEGQAAELTAWNRELEAQVHEHVAELERLRRLQRFLSPALVRAVVADPEERLLEVHRGEIAVVVCELRGFSDLATAADPEDAVGALQSFHDVLHGAVDRHDATVGSSTGERVLVLFNDPVPCPDPVDRAVTLALDLRHGAADLVDQWLARGYPLGVASGISFGHATLGFIGPEGGGDYTAVGPVVAEASTLAAGAAAGEVAVAPRARAELSEHLADRLVEPSSPAEGTAPASPAPSATPAGATSAPGPVATHPIGIGVLGPLVVTVNGRTVEISAGKSRALLARLAAAPGVDVSVDRLATDLWGVDAADDGAVRNLRVHVSRLRKALQDAGADDVLVTRPSAYRLAVPTASVDAARFDTLVAEARPIKTSDPDRAVVLLREALGLWRGRPYADAGESPYTSAEAARLTEDRVLAVEDCIDAELARGRHREILSELEALVVEHPLRERLWGQRMIALYRCGRQPEALRVYQELRARLAEELGLDPSPDLRALEQGIARRAPELDPPPTPDL